MVTLEPLTVINIAPPHGASSIDPTTTIIVSFSRALDPATVTVESVLLTRLDDARSELEAVAVEVAYDQESFGVVLTPDAPLDRDTSYLLRLTTAISDDVGETLPAEITSTFSTV